jgi:hypothetical protein
MMTYRFQYDNSPCTAVVTVGKPIREGSLPRRSRDEAPRNVEAARLTAASSSKDDVQVHSRLAPPALVDCQPARASAGPRPTA